MNGVPDHVVRMHLHPHAQAWAWAAAVLIAGALRRDLMQRPRARVVLSGHPRLAPVYRALSKAPLPWDRIDVGLADEGWLQPDDPQSAAWQVRTHLLQNHAATAHLEPITQPGLSLEDVVARANAHARQDSTIALLDMGARGALGGLAPGSVDLERALQSQQAYLMVDLSGAPGAQPGERRITLTPAGLAGVRQRLLMLRGAAERDMLQQAIADDDVATWPVLAARDAGNGPLLAHWCP